MAIFSLVLAGTAGAFGYGSMISSAPLPVLSPSIKATNQPINAANAKSSRCSDHRVDRETGAPGSFQSAAQPFRLFYRRQGTNKSPIVDARGAEIGAANDWVAVLLAQLGRLVLPILRDAASFDRLLLVLAVVRAAA